MGCNPRHQDGSVRLVQTTRRVALGVAAAAGVQRLLPEAASAKGAPQRAEITQVYANTQIIRITGPSGTGVTANPFPSPISVTDLVEPITYALKVTLRDLSHPAPGNLRVALTGPGGDGWVLLMSGVGGTMPASHIDITFDAKAANSLPTSGPLTSGVFRPTCNPASYAFPAVGPQPTSGGIRCTYDYFLRAASTGYWQLWVHDASGSHDGQINRGWELELTAKATLQSVKKKKKKHH